MGKLLTSDRNPDACYSRTIVMSRLRLRSRICVPHARTFGSATMSARTRDLEFKPAQCGWSEDHKVFAVIERPLRLDRVNSTREDMKPERNLFACGESRVKAEDRPPRGDLN